MLFDSKGVIRIFLRDLVHWVLCSLSLEAYFFVHEVSVTFEMSYYIVRLYVNTLYFTLCNLNMAITIAETCGFLIYFFSMYVVLTDCLLVVLAESTTGMNRLK
jgi:hypothetical protein